MYPSQGEALRQTLDSIFKDVSATLVRVLGERGDERAEWLKSVFSRSAVSYAVIQDENVGCAIRYTHKDGEVLAVREIEVNNRLVRILEQDEDHGCEILMVMMSHEVSHLLTQTYRTVVERLKQLIQQGNEPDMASLSAETTLPEQIVPMAVTQRYLDDVAVLLRENHITIPDIELIIDKLEDYIELHADACSALVLQRIGFRPHEIVELVTEVNQMFGMPEELIAQRTSVMTAALQETATGKTSLAGRYT